jgi:hypothetical protein
MPSFMVDDIDIDVSEFVDSCDKSELKELIEILSDRLLEEKNSKLGFYEYEFYKKLDNLKLVYYQIKDEDLKKIEDVFNKYC